MSEDFFPCNRNELQVFQAQTNTVHPAKRRFLREQITWQAIQALDHPRIANITIICVYEDTFDIL